VSKRLTIGVIFGGRSVEHDVSIITGLQVIAALDPDRYESVPIYVAKTGEWYTGDILLDIASFRGFHPRLLVKRAAIPPDRGIHGLVVPLVSRWLQRSKEIHLDVAFPAIHGTHGEDGTLQGLLEMADIPYVGCGVSASAIGMNKLLTKKVLQYHGLPMLDFAAVASSDWQQDPDNAIARISEKLSYPLFVKPCSLGSSIGISRAQSEMELREAVEVALAYDDVVIVESGARDSIEVNCAVLGSPKKLLVSVCEQPLPWQNFLTYEDKYMRGEASMGMAGAERQIPAPISESMTRQVQEMAKQAFEAIGGRGLARVDCFVNERTEQIFVNELNTMPGSFSSYLWQPVGLTPRQVIDKLIEIALETHAAKQQRIFSYDAGLIQKAELSGLKFGLKGPAPEASVSAPRPTHEQVV
jgi:D-alanine-D-alanine ligase